MTFKTEFNIQTGESRRVDYTPEELADAQARAAAEQAVAPLHNINGLERDNPIAHRALREFFLGFGEAQPAFKDTLLYKRVKTVDDAIKVERAKL